MKLTTLLLVGAAALAVPGIAQAADATASTNTASQPATNADTSSNTDSNGKTAMNDTGAAASADTTGTASAVSSIPDTEKTYKRASRASDFQKEAETTRQLNQQIANANGIPKSQD